MVKGTKIKGNGKSAHIMLFPFLIFRYQVGWRNLTLTVND